MQSDDRTFRVESNRGVWLSAIAPAPSELVPRLEPFLWTLEIRREQIRSSRRAARWSGGDSRTIRDRQTYTAQFRQVARTRASGHESFKRKGDDQHTPPDDPGNPSVNFHGERRSNATHQSTTDPEARLARKGPGKEARLCYAGTCRWTIVTAWWSTLA